MINRTSVLLCLCSVMVLGLVTGCGGDADGDGPLDQVAAMRETAGNAKNAVGAMSQMRETMEQMQQEMEEGVSVEPVDFRELRALLPEELPGMERTNAAGEKGRAMGLAMSKATGEYSTTDEEDRGRIQITLTDLGSLKGAAMMGYGWMMMEIDRESDTGYERTTQYGDFPAHEKWERRGDSANGEMQVVVGNRFIVAIDGRQVEMEQIKDALERVDLEQLEKMKNEGVTRAG